MEDNATGEIVECLTDSQKGSGDMKIASHDILTLMARIVWHETSKSKQSKRGRWRLNH
jgi:hypothetical protein